MRYKVLRDCLDFSQHYRREGEIVELDAGVSVPRHFLLLDKIPEEKQKKVSNYNKLTKAELLEIAEEQGLRVSARTTRDALLRILS